MDNIGREEGVGCGVHVGLGRRGFEWIGTLIISWRTALRPQTQNTGILHCVQDDEFIAMGNLLKMLPADRTVAAKGWLGA